MLHDIRLQQYRSYADASFEFNPGVNIIIGPNASGKTNLVEAILLLALGKSYRARDAELLQHGQDWARLDAVTDAGHRTLKLVTRPPEAVDKLFDIQGVVYKRLSLQKTLPIVLFEPNHLQLLSGSPEARREYLDGIIEQYTPGYATVRRQYKRVVAQRNSLLKQEHVRSEQLFVWNIRLSQLGGQIARERQALMSRIAAELENLYQQLSRTTARVTVAYSSTCVLDQYSSDLLYKLEQSLSTDIQRGFTTHGPHRDDMIVLLGGYPIADVASRGETRTLLLALKIIELRIIEQSRALPPLLLLDDVFSELDGARRRALTEVLQGHQTFITTTDADIVTKDFAQTSTVISLSQ